MGDKLCEYVMAHWGALADWLAALSEWQLKLAAPELTEFQVHLDDIMGRVELMKDIIRKVGGNTAAGLRAAAVSAAEEIIRAMEGAA